MRNAVRFFHYVSQFADGQGFRKVVALKVIDLFMRQICHLILRFHAFNDNFHPQRLCHIDNTINQFGRVRRAGNPVYKQLIDFNQPDRQTGE